MATPYVMEGILRFITEQYAENLPVGGMLGYVLDGDLLFAHSKIQAAIMANRCSVRLTAVLAKNSSFGSVKRFSSRHRRPLYGTAIEIRHAFLAFPDTTRQKRE